MSNYQSTKARTILDAIVIQKQQEVVVLKEQLPLEDLKTNRNGRNWHIAITI